MGRFLRPVRYGAKIVEALNDYPEQFGAEQAWKELGQPEITLREFATLASAR